MGRRRRKIAFVLGGGGHLGAYEVGMLQALLEADVLPDLVLGTSVGALNGVAVAARPDLTSVERLATVWRNLAADPVFGGSVFASAATLVRTRTAIQSNARIRSLIRSTLEVDRFEDLAVPFQCVAANVERAEERWFDRGPLEPAILASTAVPGLLPVVEIDGEHFMDGGLVNSIPVQRAFDLRATEVYVLHVGRVERPLTRPTNLFQVAMVAFEIARRNRFARDMVARPEGVEVHVLPTGAPLEPADGRTRSGIRSYRDVTDVADRIERAHRASRRYLARSGRELAR
jgi:NTE family protein